MTVESCKPKPKFTSNADLRAKYLKTEMLPTIFCPGCGIGVAMNALLRAFDELQVDTTKVVLVSGIGCSARVPGYLNLDSIHTTHGRALAFATGIKLSNPELKVIVFSGDGDLVGIGGNHFMHAARRNIDLTVIAINNGVFAMTGGQQSPTTPQSGSTTTFEYGNPEYPLNISGLAHVAGAVYVARWAIDRPLRLIKSIKTAIQATGFSLVEVLSPCPTNYGRRNMIAKPADYLQYYKEKTYLYDRNEELDDLTEENSFLMPPSDKPIAVGEFTKVERADYLENYKLVAREAKQH
ncbi:MAG TPA: thiamine pyrophosphate-dependent enzyme, partial [Candidatus Lokiarchaeia archaeon]|nr:thiamine pyrophosphate-dependent enzyme [Candidatus Lokiarchaeia archaeon]